MAKYRVHLNALAIVRGSVSIEAASEKEAEELALLETGDIRWIYDGLDENHKIQIEYIHKRLD